MHRGTRRLLVVGAAGDVAMRVLRALPRGAGRRGPRPIALVRASTPPETLAALRALGATPLVADLDDPASLRRLAGLAARVLVTAPPPAAGDTDPRLGHLIRALRRGARVPARVVAVGTTGVYGDAGGAVCAETRPLAPSTARARRRADGEWRLRRWGAERAARQLGRGVSAGVLRVPGIQAPDRAGGDPRERLRRGEPVIAPPDDPWTNRIHADDLARACIASLWRGRPQRAVNVCDDSDEPMGAWFTRLAALAGLPAPTALPLAQARTRLTPMQMSFLGESRRLDNGRMKRELRVRLRWPDTAQAFAAGAPTALADGADAAGGVGHRASRAAPRR